MPRKEQLEALLAEDPHDVFLHYALACELIKQGDCEAGFARFATIHDAFPDYVPAWFRHAQLLSEHGETDEAKAVGRQALQTAVRTGDQHAAGEIQGFLNLLD
jgi:thioredoxin-like negative regulator of GroEL